ncbi:4769_t:CDS:2, partial [Cetraspora pellucida]
TMSYPHTGDAIREFLMRKVQEFNLQNKIFCVVTDNGSNMVAAIRDWNGVERLPCTAHTLQLSVNHAFRKKHEQISCIQSLVKFFNSPKQSQRLDTAQIKVSKKKTKEISDNSSDESEDHSNSEDEHNKITDNNKANINKFTSTLQNIKDIPTHWNSKFQSWKRLLELRFAIRWLLATLPLQGEDAQKDSIKLQKLMLQENEWELVQRLVKMLEPFNSATEYFSSGKYPTIASIHPLMEAMKAHYAKNIDINEYDNNDNEEIPNYDSESDSSDEEEEESDISSDAQENQSDNSELIVKDTQTIIYNSLFEYWDRPSQICLLSTLLDPQLKEMAFTNEEARKNTIDECRYQLRHYINVASEESIISSSSINLSSNNMFKDLIFGKAQRLQESMDDLDSPNSISNTLKLARKYLGVPTTSASSKCIFSDAGNHITPRRSNLKPKLVSRMLFLKRNDNFVNMFSSSHIYKTKDN